LRRNRVEAIASTPDTDKFDFPSLILLSALSVHDPMNFFGMVSGIVIYHVLGSPVVSFKQRNSVVTVDFLVVDCDDYFFSLVCKTVHEVDTLIIFFPPFRQLVVD
jgi:hypothetical protein